MSVHVSHFKCDVRVCETYDWFSEQTILKLSLGVKALTALVEDVQLQHITGTHSISLTNDVFKFGIFGDHRWPIPIAECIFAIVHNWPVIVGNSVGDATFLF